MSCINKTKVRRILERDGSACAYCDNALDMKSVRMDHVLPKVKGGSSRDENLTAACARCNGLKWDYSMEVFIEKVVAKYERAAADAEHYAKILRKAGVL